MNTPLNTILNWFQTGDFPTEAQFVASWSSFRHKDDAVPADQVSGLSTMFQQTASIEAFNTHIADSNAHAGYLAKLDATNLTATHRNAWRSKLGVSDIPANVALVDQNQDSAVYNKAQINALSMLVADFVQNGKIRADKIESLGLTELIMATETSLSAFVIASGNYIFEKNDFIAIPVNGSYSLYMFKGGDKKTSANYLPTGLTNITISMVEGLQTALNSKLDKPSGIGNYFIRQNGSATSFAKVEPSSYYLTLFNGSDFVASNAYFTDNKIGLGTQVPTEMLHLNDGRIRTKSVVLDSNTETLPNQLTSDGTRLYGSNSSGNKRPVMFQDYNAELELWQGFNDSQKTALKTVMNGGWTTQAMSVAVTSPPVVGTGDSNSWITLKGANLNLNPNNFKLELMDSSGINVIAEIPSNQVQTYPSGLDLIFYYNFKDLPVGVYRIRIWNGVAYYITGPSVTITKVSNLTALPLGRLTWESLLKTPGTPNVAVVSGNGITLTVSGDNYPTNSSQEIVAALKSSQLIGSNNFYLKGNITIFGGNYDNGGGIVGLGNDSPLSFSNINSAFLKAYCGNFRSSKVFTTGVSGQNLYIEDQSSAATAHSAQFIIVRNGSTCTIVLTNAAGTTTVLQTISTEPLHIYAYSLNGSNNQAASRFEASFTEGYEF